MDIKITAKRENKLLERAELEGEIGFTGATPSYEQLKKELSTHLKTDEATIAIKHVYTDFGNQKATFTANVYSTTDKLKAVEPKIKEKKAKEGENKEEKK